MHGTEKQHIHHLSEEVKFEYTRLLQAAAVGIVGGLFVTAYKYALESLKDASSFLYALVRVHPAFIPLVLAVLVGLAVLTALLLRFEPWARGGGIPQVKAQVDCGVKQNFLKAGLCKFFGGAISMFAGLGLGREGPSVQLGACSADGLSKVFKKGGKEQKRFLLACGAAAGLAAAFNAPLAGAIIALEEFRKDFSPIKVLSALAASAFGALTANLLGCPVYSAFSANARALPLSAYGFVLAAAVLLGFLGLGYNKLLLFLMDKTKRVPLVTKLIPIFIIAGCVGLFLPLISYDGHDILTELIACGEAFNFSALKFLGVSGLAAIALILAFQLAFCIICTASGAPGGNFFPVMVTGALVGTFLGLLFSRFMGMNEGYLVTFTLLGMAGSLTAVVRVPFTAAVLILELTGSTSHMLPIVIVVLVANLIPDMFNCRPIFDSMLVKMPEYKEALSRQEEELEESKK